MYIYCHPCTFRPTAENVFMISKEGSVHRMMRVVIQMQVEGIKVM